MNRVGNFQFPYLGKFGFPLTEEALDCFLRTKMDVLVMEDWVVERKR